MRLFYNPDAVAYHDHPMNIVSFRQRQYNVGSASRIFLKRHPELNGFLGDRKQLIKWALLDRTFSAVGKGMNLADRMMLPLPHGLYGMLLKASYARGTLLL